MYVCIKISVSYFILRSSNSWRKCPCYLQFATHALKEMFLKTVCTFFMKLLVSKDNFLLTKLSTNQNWPKSIKFIIAKTICVLKKRAHVFFKCYHKEHVFKIIKQKSITFLSWSSWKSNKDIFFEYFPRPNFAQRHSVWVIDIYMKWKLDYLIFVLHIQFFLDSLEFQVNQENLHPTLTLSKPFGEAA